MFGQAAAHRGGIEDDGGAFAFAELDQAEGVFDGVQVGGGGAAGHQNEIGDVQGVAGRHVRTAGGVDEDQVGVLRLGLLDQGRELRGRDFDHRRRSGAAALAPFVGGRLRVDIEEGNALAMALGADGEVRGEGAFSGTPLLADQSDGFHGLNFIPSFWYDGMYIIPQALSTWISCRPPPRWPVLAVTPYYVYCYTLLSASASRACAGRSGRRGTEGRSRSNACTATCSTSAIILVRVFYHIKTHWGVMRKPYNHTYRPVIFLVSLIRVIFSDFEKNKMNIIHISDIHFGNTASTFVRSDIKMALINFLKTINDNPVIVISGDVTYKGSKNGFDEAKKFFNYVINFGNLNRSRILACPGNHDLITEEKPFTSFNEFIYSLRRDNILDFREKNFSSLKIDDVFFLVVNSSYHLNHKYGLVDESVNNYIHCKKEEIDKCVYKVAITHHHLLNQFKDDVSATRNAYPLLYSLDLAGFNLILHGHQHVLQTMPIGNNCMRIESSRSFNYNQKGYNNGVNQYFISDNKLDKKVYLFSKDDNPTELKLVR